MIRKLAVVNLVLLSILLASAVVNVWTRDGLAQSVSGFTGLFSSLQLQATDPVVGNDSNSRRAVDISCTINDVNTNSGYSDQNCMVVRLTANQGQNVYGNGTNAKRTFLPLFIEGDYYAAGQKFLYENTINCWGMGDCAIWSNNAVNYAGGPVAGDEGTGFQTASGLNQQGNLTLATVTGVATTSCNTTLTQAVSGGYAVQNVTVASTTGCNVNDWIVIAQTLPNGNYGYPNDDAVQITAIGSGRISGVFHNNQSSGATVTPALVLNFNSGAQLGQQRKLVNLSRPSYSTGTVAAISGGELTGTGTAWTANMVGGSTANIGCISLTADIYSGPFSNGQGFNGSGSNGPLNSWYEITSVIDGTHLTISSMSTAGDLNYHGRGPGPTGSGSGPSSYVIRPCVEVLRVYGNGVIGESTSTTWGAGDNVELAISPYPDVTGFQYYMAAFTPGGAHRGFEYVRNNGARQFGFGFSVESALQSGSNADTVGWANAYQASGVGVGLNVTNAATAALSLDQSSPSGAIAWGTASGILSGAYIAPNTDGGLDFQLDMGQSLGNGGFLRSYGHNSGVLGPGNSLAGLSFGGVFGTVPKTFSQLMTCGSAVEGFETAVTDSTTATFAATISGGGSNHVKAYCNGTNWTVH